MLSTRVLNNLISGEWKKKEKYNDYDEKFIEYHPDPLRKNLNDLNDSGIGSSREENSVADISIVDLDLVVDKFIRNIWEGLRDKNERRSTYDMLDIHVNWDQVEINQEPAVFENKRIKQPTNQTLFKTFFTNKTNQVQEYSFKTERTTRQSCSFSFSKGFSREKEASISIKIPDDILEIGGGIKSEQTIDCGKDRTNEEEMKWGCDSMIRVEPQSEGSAKLVITELEMERSFSVTAYFKGDLQISISDKKGGFHKTFYTDMVQIISMAYQMDWLPNSSNFKIITSKDGDEMVKSTLRGKCKFNLGVQQHIEINEEKYDSPVTFCELE